MCKLIYGIRLNPESFGVTGDDLEPISAADYLDSLESSSICECQSNLPDDVPLPKFKVNKNTTDYFNFLELLDILEAIVETPEQELSDEAQYACDTSFEVGYNLGKNESTLPGIKSIKFSPPATIVFWDDGTKTVVKDEEWNQVAWDNLHNKTRTNWKFNGLAHAIAKKAIPNYCDYANGLESIEC